MKDILTIFATESASGTSTITAGGDTGDSYDAGGKINNVGPDEGTNLIGSIIDILNVVIGVLGIIAVIVIIIGGIQYMTSTGDAGKVKKAKDTILYGVIGLIVCILAFAIVNFIIANVAGGN